MTLHSFFKTSITTLFLCLFSFKAVSQVVYSNKESSTFSFTVGMTNSNLINDSVKYRTGTLFNGGFIYTIVLSDKLNVGLEALYTGKAFRNESPLIKYRYFYIDVPLYLQYKLSESVRFNLGAQYSSFTNSKIIILDGQSTSGVKIQPYTNIKPADIGVLFGAEVDLSKNLSLAARYTISTSTFYQKNSINFGVFQVSLNYAVYRTHKQFLNRHKEKE
jgi:hypothetical protein